MKTLFLAVVAALLAHEAVATYRVERYAEAAALPVSPIIFRQADAPARNAWRPIITPGWPLTSGRWTIKWEGTF